MHKAKADTSELPIVSGVAGHTVRGRNVSAPTTLVLASLLLIGGVAIAMSAPWENQRFGDSPAGVGAEVRIGGRCADWISASIDEQSNVSATLLSMRRLDRDGIDSAPTQDQIALLQRGITDWCSDPPQEVVAELGDSAMSIEVAADAKYEAYRDYFVVVGDESAPSPS